MEQVHESYSGCLNKPIILSRGRERQGYTEEVDKAKIRR